MSFPNGFMPNCPIHMLTIASALAAFLWIASDAMGQQPPAESNATSSANETSTLASGLIAEHLYNGVNRPCIITVTSPRTFGTVTLALMDQFGVPLAPKIQVHPGRVDLSAALPEGVIWQLDRAAYLQLLDGDQPVGSALVLQPLLSRMVPKTAAARRPNGATYTLIIDWIDENQPPPPAPPPPAATAPAVPPPVTDFNKKKDGSDQPPSTPPLAPGSAGGTTGTNTANTQPPAEIPAQPIVPVPRLLSGLRIYPETDVILHTTKGDIRIALRPDEAPNTAWNFLELSRNGFYRDIPFHRVVPFTATGQPFVIQAGDPTADAIRGGDGGAGYWLPIEPSRLPHDFGVISMARSDDPDSAGSQFFIALSHEGCARLDGQYCSFGYAVDGAEAIKSIAQVELANIAEGRPVNPPVIKDAELAPAPPRTPGEGRPDRRVTPENPSPAATRPNRVAR